MQQELSKKEVFGLVKSRANLIDYIVAHASGQIEKTGKDRRINPSPCCGHNDCFTIKGPEHTDFICYSCGKSGDVFQAAEFLNNLERGEALKNVAEHFGVQLPKPNSGEPVTRSLIDGIADNCIASAEQVTQYLVEERAICAEVVKNAIAKKTLGFNTYTSRKHAAGEKFHGGPAAAFIARDIYSNRVAAVDMRYLDPALNGGLKTQCQGDKKGNFWCADPYKLKRAHTVYFVESSINAVSIDSAGIHGAVGVSILGTNNAEFLDLQPFIGKQVIICMDNDAPDDKGNCAGAKAAWRLHERCTAHNIAALLVDWSQWRLLETPYNDVNDILKDVGPSGLKTKLKAIEPWLIPGLPGNSNDRVGNPRVYLPELDYSKYWRYRVKKDFTTYVNKFDSGDDGPIDFEYQDLCGFRIAGLSRVTISSATATMSGEQDFMPLTLFAVAVQTPRHKADLLRRVMEDHELHNVDQWKKFGPVFSPASFARMLSILERTADIGARKAINFVGVAWKDGQLVVNEGPDCYFSNPKQQCPYHNLSFPSGSPIEARRVINAYQDTFKGNAALIMLVWALGAHLKALLDFWPHMQLQADKGTGKSTLIKSMERAIAFTMFSGQSLQTEFRLLTSISSTSHPVGWEEISARRQDIIDKAVAMLQESYQHGVTRRGSDMTEFLLSAPVLLAGEDVPVSGITGKLVRASLKLENQGDLIPDDLPQFPVRGWLNFICSLTRAQVKTLYNNNHEYCKKNSRATGHDAGAKRMIKNYAALLTAWALLAEFAGLSNNQGNIVHDIIREMNEHIAETSGDREPWVTIISVFLSEIARSKFRYPYDIARDSENKLYIAVMPGHIMDHIKTDTGLRSIWDSLSIKTPRILKKQLDQAGVISNHDIAFTTGRIRQTHAIAIDAASLEKYGLHLIEPQIGREGDV